MTENPATGHAAATLPPRWSAPLTPHPTLVYLSGPPAAGKSTLMQALTWQCTRTPAPGQPAHDTLTPPPGATNRHLTAVELGRRRDRFSGTDALPLNVQPAAVTWIGTRPAELVLAEGDRLANIGFLTAATRAGYHVHLLALDAPGTVLDARCAARGSTQNASWRAGRITKAARLANLAETLPNVTVTRLDTRANLTTLTHAALAAAPPLGQLTVWPPPPPPAQPA